MTVAYPTAGIAAPQRETVPLTCPACRARAASPREPFCAHCGSRLSLTVRGGIASLAATRALQFALAGVVANILIGGTSFGVVFLLSDAARLTQGALGLEALRFIVVGTVLAIAIRYGVRGLAQTRDGALTRRAWAITAIVVASFLGLLITGSFVATGYLFFVL